MDNTNAEVQEQTGAEEQKEQQVDINAVMNRLEQLEQTNQRLLEESKQYKNKYRGLRDEVETKEKAKLEESENWKELLDREKNEKMQLADQVRSYKQQTLKQNINFEVARHAPNAFDVNDVITSLPKDMLQMDEETLEVKGIEDAVNLVKEKKPWLFDTKKSTGMASQRPVADNGNVRFEDLSKEEQNELFKKALSQM
jgi:oligoendopeptidase F